MRFKDAVGLAAHPVSTAYQSGKKALEGKHRSLINCAKPQEITGSVNLDATLARLPAYASEPRWDYGLGYKAEGREECAIWVEVHSAKTSEVSSVLRKLDWLQDWLNSNALELRDLTRLAEDKNRFVWIASNGVHVPPNSRQFRLLSTKSIRLVGRALNLT